MLHSRKNLSQKKRAFFSIQLLCISMSIGYLVGCSDESENLNPAVAPVAISAPTSTTTTTAVSNRSSSASVGTGIIPNPQPSRVVPRSRSPRVIEFDPNPYAYIVETDGDIISIGDVHGDLRAALCALYLAGAIAAPEFPFTGTIHSLSELEIVRWARSTRWIASNLVVVQTGDQLDGWHQDKTILDLFHRLAQEAVLHQSHFIILNGNHEALNVVGQLDYVTHEAHHEFESLPIPESVPVRFLLFLHYVFWGDGVSFLSNRLGPYQEVDPLPQEMPSAIALNFVPTHDHSGQLSESTRQAVLNRVYQFAPRGGYAQLLAERSFYAIVNRTVFVHGGIPHAVLQGRLLPQFLREQVHFEPREHLDLLNRTLQAWMNGEPDYPDATVERILRSGVGEVLSLPTGSRMVTFEEIIDVAFAHGGHGYLASIKDAMNRGDSEDIFNDPVLSPLWVRNYGFSRTNLEAQYCTDLHATLTALDVDQMVIGHTVQQRAGITPTCDRKLWRTDVALSRRYRNSRNQAAFPFQILRIRQDSIDVLADPLYNVNDE